ncbi:hypothetical protein [Paractinoplanes atraurantiacus]|uniref:Uncharacterized protein n=1 Tax=Paractinoplanes atraurantiacus TaxID=1036182 RepID=A0A285KGE6_9ACTN|nr:hypothetical protein [Actinoplanes atraurantiacus]SNY71690.1 hypothetical protein SAMN05421748_14083 [Actinoplanes atraurantiacus]
MAGSGGAGSDAKKAEEEILEKLEPGGTYARLKQLLNQEPDREEKVQEGLIVAQFAREKREKIPASAIIVTVPEVDITTAMLRFTYDFAGF